MNKVTKVLLISAGGCLALGLLVSGVALAFGGSVINRSGTEDYEPVSYEASGEVTSIVIDEGSFDIKLVPYDGDKVKIDTYDTETYEHSFDLNNGTLTVNATSNRKWYQMIRIDVSLDVENKQLTTVYIPEGEYEDLDLEVGSGDIVVESDSLFEDVVLHSGSGDISIDNPLSGNLKIDGGSGDAFISNMDCSSADVDLGSGNVAFSNVTVAGTLYAHSGSGDIHLTDTSAGSLTLEAGSGNIDFTNLQVSSADIDIGSGDVTGSVIGDYDFDADCGSGDVEINHDDISSGNPFKVDVGSGDVTIN